MACLRLTLVSTVTISLSCRREYGNAIDALKFKFKMGFYNFFQGDEGQGAFLQTDSDHTLLKSLNGTQKGLAGTPLFILQQLSGFDYGQTSLEADEIRLFFKGRSRPGEETSRV